VLRALPAAPAPVQGSRTAVEASGHGVLVQVLLGEGDVDGAWAAARRGGCRGDIWIEVAQAKGNQAPCGRGTGLQRLGASALGGGNRSAYGYGASLIQRAHRFAETAGLGFSEASAAWILGIREQNRRRPALQDEFNRHRLPKAR
jgi:hypothetical protein